jgi:Ran GTPase-activating protein (RanGAP) involved in mRNA processing and transport
MHPYTTKLVKNLLLPSWFDVRSAVKSNSGGDPINCIDIIDGGDYGESGTVVGRLRNAIKENKLRYLVLSKIEMDEDVIDALVDLLRSAPSPWEALYLEFCGGDLGKTIQSVLKVDNIKKLEIAGDISSEYMNSLSRSLAACKSLQELSFVITFDSQKAKTLVEGLRANTGIRRLKLVQSTLKNDSIEPISSFLAQHGKLEVLHLDRCIVSETDFATLLTSLRNVSTLKELSIGGALHVKEIRSAICSLMNQNLLSKLSLHGVTPKCSQHGINDLLLTTSLSENHSLRILDLSGNKLEDHNLNVLMDFLCSNAYLVEELRLQENCITNVGARLLGKRLHKTRGLKRIFLHRNKFDERGVAAILEGVRSNHQIHEVTIPTLVGDAAKLSRLRTLINYETSLNAGGKEILRNQEISLKLWPQVFHRARNILFTPYCEPQMRSLRQWKRIQSMDVMFYLLRHSDIGRSKDSNI